MLLHSPAKGMGAAHRIAAGSFLLALALWLFLSCNSPEVAQALFNETAGEQPAMQDLGEVGDIVYPADIPEGQVFRVEARTTSRMCILYENASDCANRTNKEQCLIQRQGDTILAVFYLSQAYTHIYLGTGEEAAALTNEDGTDDSAYIAGEPSTGYVPHLFNLPIAALNYPITMATYSGGSNGRELWYTRQVVFKPSGELMSAINGGSDSSKAPSEEAEEPGQTDGAEQSDDGDQSNVSEDSGNQDGSETTDGQEQDGQGYQDFESIDTDAAGETIIRTTGGAVTYVSDASGGNSNANDGSGAAKLDSDVDDGTTSFKPIPGTTAVKKGIRMSIAGFDFPDESGGPLKADALDEGSTHELTPVQLVCIFILVGLGIGALWRTATFFRGFGSRAKPAADNGPK